MSLPHPSGVSFFKLLKVSLASEFIPPFQQSAAKADQPEMSSFPFVVLDIATTTVQVPCNF